MNCLRASVHDCEYHDCIRKILLKPEASNRKHSSRFRGKSFSLQPACIQTLDAEDVCVGLCEVPLDHGFRQGSVSPWGKDIPCSPRPHAMQNVWLRDCPGQGC